MSTSETARPITAAPTQVREVIPCAFRQGTGSHKTYSHQRPRSLDR